MVNKFWKYYYFYLGFKIDMSYTNTVKTSLGQTYNRQGAPAQIVRKMKGWRIK